jgi:hypothetical protein
MPTLNYKTATDSFCRATQKDRTITGLLPTGVGLNQHQNHEFQMAIV